MGRQSRQMAMIFVDIESLIPETHLLRKIERMVSFNFIYDLLAPYYPATGRPSVDPVSMFKMLLIGYLYGIKSERRLVEEVQLNIAYRWFCGFELDHTIPNHSTFSKTRTRKMPVCAVQNGRAVLTRLEFGAECWPAVAIRHFSEGISAWELLNTCP